MVSSPSKPRRRSISAAAKPAAPPPTMTIRRGGSPVGGGIARPLRRRAFRPTMTSSPRRSTRQRASGSKAGARERLAGAQAEAGVMPGAPHGIADDDPVGERRAVMGALCADREHVVALPDEEDRLVADMPFKEGAVAQSGERNALGKVRPSGPSACDPIRTSIPIRGTHWMRLGPRGSRQEAAPLLIQRPREHPGSARRDADRRPPRSSGL